MISVTDTFISIKHVYINDMTNNFDITMIMISTISGIFSGCLGGIVGCATKSILFGIIFAIVFGLGMVSVGRGY